MCPRGGVFLGNRGWHRIADARWFEARSRHHKRVVEGVAEAAAAHPGDAIALQGVDDELYHSGFDGHPFLLVGAERVWRVPGDISAEDLHTAVAGGHASAGDRRGWRDSRRHRPRRLTAAQLGLSLLESKFHPLFMLNKPSLLDRLKAGIQKTRAGLLEKIEDAVSGRKEIDAGVLDELEYALITADIGTKTTSEILERIRQRVERAVTNSAQLKSLIKEQLLEILEATERPLPHIIEPPRVIMVVGVNGAGKTVIGKLTRRLQSEGKTVLLCAADAFRAAIERLKSGPSAGADLIRQQPGSDPSAVLFDALTAAKARKMDVVIADTAGRLHTKVNPDGGARRCATPPHALTDSRCAPRSPVGVGSHHRSKRIGTGAQVYRVECGHRNHPHQARRHGEAGGGGSFRAN